MVRTADRDCVNPLRPPAATKQLGPAKPFSRLGEDVLKPGCPIKGLDQTTRFGHVVIHPQLFLPPVLQEMSGRDATCGRVRLRKGLIIFAR